MEQTFMIKNNDMIGLEYLILLGYDICKSVNLQIHSDPRWLLQQPFFKSPEINLHDQLVFFKGQDNSILNE